MINLQKEIQTICVKIDQYNRDDILKLAGNLVERLGENNCREFYQKDCTLFDHDKYMFNAERAIYDYTLYMINSYINEKKLNKSLDFEYAI